jgi:hypothetical protein
MIIIILFEFTSYFLHKGVAAYNDTLTTPPPQLYLPPKQPKKKIIRGEKNTLENTEEAACFLCNLFYVFFFPIVCRCSDLETWHIPKIHSKDYAHTATERGEIGFAKKYKVYLEEKEEYDRKKREILSGNSEEIERKLKELKEPSKPSYLSVLIFDVGNYELWMSFLILLFSFFIFFFIFFFYYCYP